MSIKTLNALLLAGVLSLVAASAVQATEGNPVGSNDNNGRNHAGAVPVCGDLCLVLVEDTGPGTAGDHNCRADLSADTHPMLAEDGPPGSPGDHNGRSAALSQGGGEFRVAGGRGGLGGEV
jgi:hypothetical protein